MRVLWSDHRGGAWTRRTATASAPRAWRIVLERIESDLLDGRLAPGDRLPRERELAATLGVGRSSVREALRVLEVMGLIRTGTGSGPTSGAIIIATPRGGMSALLRLQVAASGFPLDDVVATRLVLESAVVEALAADARPVDGRRARRARRDGCRGPDPRRVPRPRRAAPPRPRRGVGQRRHRRDDGGPAHRDRVLRPGGRRSASRTGTPRPRACAREHRAILDAVDAGDAARARTLIHDHITGYYADAGLARAPR